MRILVLAATLFEITPFIDKDTGIDVLIAGVGTPSTIYHLQKKLIGAEYDMVIQAGIAGRFASSNLSIGETALVEADVFADLGVEECKTFHSISELGFSSANDFPFDNDWLINTDKILSRSTLPKVKAVSVNKISDDPFQTEIFVNRYNPGLESMEGAACHFVCLHEHKRFLQLRSISNSVADRDKSRWEIEEAIQQLNFHLLELINQINTGS